MNLGALFPNLGGATTTAAAPAAAYPGTAGGFGGWWIWILIIFIFIFLFNGSALGRPGYGPSPGLGGGFFGRY